MAKPISSIPQLKSKDFLKLLKEDETPLTKQEFNCGDQDLNDFIHEDSFIYEQKLLAKTYLVFIKEKLIGYFSLLNDKIQKAEDVSKTEWNKKVKEDLSYQKNNLLELPSLKIGRLA